MRGGRPGGVMNGRWLKLNSRAGKELAERGQELARGRGGGRGQVCVWGGGRPVVRKAIDENRNIRGVKKNTLAPVSIHSFSFHSFSFILAL